MRQLLIDLFTANAKRGEFRAQGNTLFLYDVIVRSEADAEFFGGVSPEAFLREISAMSGPLTIRINSPGGEVFAALTMAQHVREYPDEVTILIDGLCASAATFIAAAGARVVMARGAMMMIHKAATIAAGNADRFRGLVDRLEKVDATIAQIYADKSGGKPEDFVPLMAAETWFTDAEAVAIGLADEISSSGGKVTNAAERWDLSAFENAPQASAQAEDAAQDPPAPEAPPADPVETANEVREPVENTADASAAENERRRRITAARLLSTAA